MMFDYLWGEIAIIVFGMWIALLLVGIGALIGYERADYRHRKNILHGSDISLPDIHNGNRAGSDDRGEGVE